MNYERKITDFDNTIKKLVLLSTKTNDSVLIEEYQKQVKECKAEQQRLQGKKTAKENAINQLSAILSGKNKVHTAIPTAKVFNDVKISRQLVQLLIDKIHIDNDEIEIQFKT